MTALRQLVTLCDEAMKVSNGTEPDPNRLLEQVRSRIALPQTVDRQDAQEKLWDDFERLKSLKKRKLQRGAS